MGIEIYILFFLEPSLCDFEFPIPNISKIPLSESGPEKYLGSLRNSIFE